MPGLARTVNSGLALCVHTPLSSGCTASRAKHGRNVKVPMVEAVSPRMHSSESFLIDALSCLRSKRHAYQMPLVAVNFASPALREGETQDGGLRGTRG